MCVEGVVVVSFEVRKEDNSCLVCLAILAMIVHHTHFFLVFFFFFEGVGILMDHLSGNPHHRCQSADDRIYIT